MPRPTSKIELQKQGEESFTKLMNTVEKYTIEEQEKEFPEGTLNRNIRDVLAHLHHWNLMTMEWYKVGMTGVKPDMPAAGYTWKTLPDLNKWIRSEYEEMSLQETKKMVSSSFNKLKAIIASHSDNELFEKKRYKWTGSTSMGSYFVSASVSHYNWALKLIKRAKKS